jgi:hypothetical protein
MTVAPSAWNNLAVAAPMPVAPPVIRAILPSSFAMGRSCLGWSSHDDDEAELHDYFKNEELDIWTCWSERKGRLANDGLRRRTSVTLSMGAFGFRASPVSARVRKQSN